MGYLKGYKGEQLERFYKYTYKKSKKVNNEFDEYLPARGRRDNAEIIFNKIKEDYPKAEIHLTGHSLGGSLTKHLLYKNRKDKNIRGYGYNAIPHVDFEDKQNVKTDRRYIPYRAVSENMGDFASVTSDKKYKNVVNVKGKAINPFSLHSMDNFLKEKDDL